jgi:folate-binding protein YgfZ
VADVVRVEGADAATYLQGQLSQDIDAIAVGADAWSFVLEPNGHIDALVKITRTAEDAFILTVDSGLGAAVEARLRKFLLRTKANVALETGTDDDLAARVADGRPGAPEFDDRAVPAETGWVDRAVSFTKGCYTGQELVARMDSRVAEPPRHLVRLNADAALTPGAPIEVDGAEVGQVTSAAGQHALGYVKRGAPSDGDAVVGGTPARMERVGA